MRIAKFLVAALLGLAMFACSPGEKKVTISGAGATFPYPVYAKWASSYQQATGVEMNYQSIGSGGGIAQIKARTVTFGASDAPLSGAELEEAGLVQWPMVMGGIVPVIHIEGISPGDLLLDGATLASIYLGEISNWNDPAIAALNRDLDLPDLPIAVIHRSDGSGTTYNFTYYLSDVSAAWKSQVGTGKAVSWPAGLGAKGNEGVAGNVLQTAGAIGYVEYAYAEQNNMAYADMLNRDGVRVSPTAAAFAAAAVNADWKGTPGYGVILANQPGSETWPMAAATFILMPGAPEKPEDAGEALKFFAWCFDNGDTQALDLHYVPMPGPVVTDIKAMWSREILNADGQPVYDAGAE